jgi:hypothetical protein
MICSGVMAHAISWGRVTRKVRVLFPTSPCGLYCDTRTGFSASTRWFKYDRDKLWLVYTQSVPVIFEPPCTSVFPRQQFHQCSIIIHPPQTHIAKYMSLSNRIYKPYKNTFSTRFFIHKHATAARFKFAVLVTALGEPVHVANLKELLRF